MDEPAIRSRQPAAGNIAEVMPPDVAALAAAKGKESAMQEDVIVGRCTCGAVSFELTPPIRDVIVCHCRQCARWTGYAVAAAAVAPQNLRLRTGGAELKWFSSSSHAQRGFCSVCGSSLFWKPADATRIAVLAGTIEPPTRLAVAAHVYVGDKSDYYEIGDEAPQFAQGADGVVLLPR